jgi:hypothetical protein
MGANGDTGVLLIGSGTLDRPLFQNAAQELSTTTTAVANHLPHDRSRQNLPRRC